VPLRDFKFGITELAKMFGVFLGGVDMATEETADIYFAKPFAAFAEYYSCEISIAHFALSVFLFSEAL